VTDISRRALLGFLAAPVIVRAGSLMSISVIRDPPLAIYLAPHRYWDLASKLEPVFRNAIGGGNIKGFITTINGFSFNCAYGEFRETAADRNWMRSVVESIPDVTIGGTL